jgi:hypothetical protein
VVNAASEASLSSTLVALLGYGICLSCCWVCKFSERSEPREFLPRAVGLVDAAGEAILRGMFVLLLFFVVLLFLEIASKASLCNMFVVLLVL